MDQSLYLISFIALAALATVATRALPFLFLARHSQHPLLEYLGRYLPPVLMVLLVVYAVSDLPMANQQWVISLGSLILVAVTQWLSKNALLSIALGSLLYMVLI